MYYNNKKLALSIFWVIAGIVLLVLSVAEVLTDTLYAGMGGALIVVGMLQVIRNIRYRKDEEYNSFIRMKSWSWTGWLTILIEGIGVIVAMVLGQRTVQLVLSYSVCLILVIYLVTGLILSRKY